MVTMAQRLMLNLAAILHMVCMLTAQCPGDCDCSNYNLRKEIRCTSNGLTSIPSNLPSDTQILRLEFNRIGSITSADLSAMIHLKQLTLYNNLISSIDEGAFENQRDLQVLNLKYNSITVIHRQTFRNTHKLVELSLGNNILQSLENGTFDGLAKLNELDLDGNPLQSLPDGIFNGLTNLHLLDISNVLLESIPSTLFHGLTNLETLKLNNITQNGDELFNSNFSFSSVSALSRLEIRKNSLNCIPVSLIVLTNLKILKISMNPLTCSNFTVLRHLQGLEELHLDNTGLTTLSSNMFAGNTNLVFLLIEYSNLSVVEESAFMGLSRLEDLYFSSNNLTSLPNNVFDPLPNNVNLELDNNPWHCDCELRWLHTWLTTSYTGYISDNRQPECTSPDRLNGHRVLDIIESEYACMPETNQNETITHLVNEGENFVLECRISGNPLPALHWLTPDHTELFPNTNQIPFNVDAECTLTIIRITKEDAGTYSCTGTNAAGTINVRSIVTVTGTGNDPNKLTTDSHIPSNTTPNQSESLKGQKESTLVISVAVVAFILILALVLAIVVVIHRRNNRKDHLQHGAGEVLFRNGRATLPSLPSCTLPYNMTMPCASVDERYADTSHCQPTTSAFGPPPPYSTIPPSANDGIYQEITTDDDLYEEPRDSGDISAAAVGLGHTYMSHVSRQDSCISSGSCGAPAGYERSMIRDVGKPRRYNTSTCGSVCGAGQPTRSAQKNLYVAMNDRKENKQEMNKDEKEVRDRLPDLSPNSKVMYENARR